MKNVAIILFTAVSLVACKTKAAADTANLPKDISLKPENNLGQQQDRQQLSLMIKDIEDLIAKENCNSAAEWKYAPIGAKPCGGPSSYIAYPEKMEAEILRKIEQFTQKQRDFNQKYQLMSDCMMVMPPTEIKCVEGKAVLVNGNSAVTEVQ